MTIEFHALGYSASNFCLCFSVFRPLVFLNQILSNLIQSNSILRPQLYINGDFIGGNDIVSEMHESGELKELLIEAKAVDKE
mmetsp:Transcript_2870/g.6777  ORF Transcript_2870/g.6777 Transcript_2870/m.6777 type:complete len:82 (-) Transcript_2870:224-469(-)